MKAKGILQCAALLTGLLFLNVPLFAAVESDIVGYTEVTLKPGMNNLLALPFVDLASDEQGIDVRNLLQLTPTSGDTIQYWTGSSFAILTYRVRSGVGAWYSGGTKLSDSNTVYIKKGQGFWYSSCATEDVTARFSGRVALTGQEISAPQGLSLIGTPVPADYDIADIQFEGIASGSTLQYWNYDSRKFDILTYRVRSGVGAWYSGGTKLTSYTIPAAVGFWFSSSSGTTTIRFPAL